MIVLLNALCPLLLVHLPSAGFSLPRVSDGSAFESLSFDSSVQSNGPRMSGWLRGRYANSSDVDVDTVTAGDQDLGGFNLDNARVALSGEAGDGYAYTISIEAGDPAVSDASGTGVALLDAYAAVKICDSASVSIGRFSSTFLWRTAIEERKLVFLDRSFLGEVWDGRDVGFELSGRIGKLDWWAAAQNGVDGAANNLALSACACFHILGDALDTEEGALELGDAQHLTASVAWFDDASFDEGTAVGGALHFAQGRLSADVEIVDAADDLQSDPTLNTSTGALIPGSYAATGVQTAWDATVTWLLVPERWEIAARWQDLDDDDGTTIASAALNRYMLGHNVKWTLQFDTADSDDAALEADVISIGATVGF